MHKGCSKNTWQTETNEMRVVFGWLLYSSVNEFTKDIWCLSSKVLCQDLTRNIK